MIQEDKTKLEQTVKLKEHLRSKWRIPSSQDKSIRWSEETENLKKNGQD